MTDLTKQDSTPRLLPFLKWPGGKRWLAPLLRAIMVRELTGTYYEPFVGAGAVFLQLRPERSVLSDTNSDLIHFFNVVRTRPEEVVRAVWQCSNTAECYARVRRRVPRSDVGRAARFLFLNRTCWGGIYRTNKVGEFNVPFGDSGRRLCSLQHVIDVSAVYSNAALAVQDFESGFRCAKSGDAIYADPPYTGKGENNGFVRYNEKLFSWSDQVRLARECRSAKQRGVFVAVSGLRHDELLSLYSGWWVLKLSRHSTVSRELASRRQITEVAIFSRKPKELPMQLRQKLKRIKT
ncbi:MAG: Dam family site-specific DNA-(adenine-N6)-methyltransferase [Planctomycetes bacterium]|nr:Dam family site-specific DNA-(adenine-N6)-methyltransferase [Planctomycetota bacterium]